MPPANTSAPRCAQQDVPVATKAKAHKLVSQPRADTACMRCWQQEACCCLLGTSEAHASFLLACLLGASEAHPSSLLACLGQHQTAGCHSSLQGGAETLDRLWAAFIAHVSAHLHIVLCMNPVGTAFRQRCRQFPALVNCCTIDWFLDWPAEALRRAPPCPNFHACDAYPPHLGWHLQARSTAEGFPAADAALAHKKCLIRQS